ncbi:MAG: M28 family peptidase [Acidobacteria bacterium]|nr:M28 family peptidase [Acidobacteriota bacterium]MBI3658413.1 M28 family peptidase [Acidobacteriota bacterium]
MTKANNSISPSRMSNVDKGGWPRLLSQGKAFHGDNRFPLPAYSEFMPGPFVGVKPYGGVDPFTVSLDDPFGWRISEYQEKQQLRPGLTQVAHHLLTELRKLANGLHSFSKDLLTDNLYWPETLSAHAGSLRHERYVVLLPLALSRTLDDKGRIRWTFFGAGAQGPARAFWRSFQTSPTGVLGKDAGTSILKNLLSQVYGLPENQVADLRRAGFRILPNEADPKFADGDSGPLPSWTDEYLINENAPIHDIHYLLTFRPFDRLPLAVQRAYLSGALHLIPFPGSLIFYGHPGYRKLADELPGAMQIPLLRSFPSRHAAPYGMRILQSGWLDEPKRHDSAPTQAFTHGRVVSHIKRTHRWNRAHRDENEMDLIKYDDRVADALFSAEPEHMGLYGKPMARNAEIWTHDYRLLLNGPRDSRQRIEEAGRALAMGGHFGYRFLFPPMRVGSYEVFWQRPLVAFFARQDQEPTVLFDGPLGYLTASAPEFYCAEATAVVEMWPKIDNREPHQAAIDLFEHEPGLRRYTTTFNIRKLLEAYDLLDGRPLTRAYARQLLTVPKETSLEQWLESLPDRTTHAKRAPRLAAALAERIQPVDPPLPSDPHSKLPHSQTFAVSAHRSFEERYWKMIEKLAASHFIQKNNADLTRSSPNARAVRDLEALGDYLHSYYQDLIVRHDMAKAAQVADHRFRWTTDFDFTWSEGWSRNQTGGGRERNIIVIIPGHDRNSAVIMADHYDTAYMEDIYEKEQGGDFTRAAAAGADDNHSATAALMMAADLLLPLSRAGKLKHDVWLVHLTGEEFPADCLGARNLAQRLVERTLVVEAEGVGRVDLSSVRVLGAYILDMVAHNNDHDRYVFQIATGEGPDAARLAQRAHLANERWNQSVPIWNAVPARREAPPYRRVQSLTELPAIAAHPALAGEIRPSWHYASSLYNTDAQIFSDAGIPVVLFMECYDINRKGYHDTQDTMRNIDLDYAAALVSIAIETVADVAVNGL